MIEFRPVSMLSQPLSSARLIPAAEEGTGPGLIPGMWKAGIGRHQEAQGKRIVRVIANNDTVERRLFEATAQAKIWTASIAMHLDRDVRDRFFSQLDRLHDAEEWMPGDAPVALESYKAFVRAVLYMGIDSAPAIALMPSGNVLAMWEADGDRLSAEFLPSDRVKWVLSRHIDGEVERAAGETSVLRLKSVLQPYDVQKWFHGS